MASASDALLALMHSMSDADLSVLDACLATPGAHVTTKPDSQNDRLWSQMAQLEWMTVREEVVAVPGRQIRMKIYAVTAKGEEHVPRLLDAVRTARA